MRKLLLGIVLVFAIAIPAFAQNGPVKIKPLLLFTQSETLGDITPWFNPGNDIYVGMVREAKGCGTYKDRIEVLNSKGVLIQKIIDSHAVCTDTFVGMFETIRLGPAPEAGYYTVKAVYVDVATRISWSHQTKIHVIPPD